MSGGGRGSGGKTPPDLQAALEHLERAVRRFAATAKGELAGRAAAFIEEATLKLERELLGESAADTARSDSQRSDSQQSDWQRSDSQRSDSQHSDSRRSGSRRSERRSRPKRARHRRRGGRQQREEHRDRGSPRKLYRDPENARIVGVCAGIADYLGAEVWVARCVALTGLIFMPGLVFPAYWILYFVLSPRPDREPDEREPPFSPEDHASPAPELGPKLSPRRSLRNLRAHLEQAELRLRRIESHVTSGQYELQKELNKLTGQTRARPDDGERVRT